jgi:hypothetical protein
LSTRVTEEEKALLITIDDIAETGVAVGRTSEAGEKYSARRYINDLTEIEYEYDSDNEPANTEIVIFFSEADTYRNEDLAIEGFYDSIEAYGLGAKMGSSEINVIEIPGHFSLGEQNYSAYLEVEGIRIGNIVVTRKEKLVYSLLLAGPHIKTSQTLHYLIGPKLEMVDE